MATDAELLELVRGERTSPQILSGLRKRFDPNALEEGVVVQWLGQFLWAIESEAEPHLYVDDQPTASLTKLPDSNVWVHSAPVLQGHAHAHYFRIRGEAGQRVDTSAFTEDHYLMDGVPQGTLSEHMLLRSETYQGYPVSWWLYASPGCDPNVPSPAMVWLDGEGFIGREARDHLFTVTENLVVDGRLPPMLHVLTSPGEVDLETMRVRRDQPRLRSLLYDSVNDDFNKMIFGEIMPQVQTMYKARTDGYSVGSCGQSSGAIGAFNMAWQRPQACSRVFSRIGTYTSIQWRWGQDNPNNRFGFQDPAGFLDGGNVFPFLIRKRPKKNIRVYLSDGSYDLENDHGSWPLQNIQMANSLKRQEYDFKFVFGNSMHNTHQGAAELPAALTWLWRDYDPAETEQTYQMDSDEKDKPYFRVSIVNR